MKAVTTIGAKAKIIVHTASFLDEKVRNFIAKTPTVSVPLFDLAHHSLKDFVNRLAR